ncbi:hypothetical protein NCU05932 [Neurospora crassa OR74A]|uniref:Lytic polysaccharide monooxygenase n=1 Tax=Neurospora crassa (strain ATCC 24698 / 74-OR23-1A / CBS 708.71 / DSM 1257 / FGSC 987) TaxID=367110 RepID=Q7S0P1_NEUCR|nr:hypothetical protein NCU05932 [Neurospora crassa OR74A]EAA28891.2 hypothetical protein NCU05932 [Neurospora crassa OR74A]|eukprot:XP_958127.2 hypothetical protein NCU05932 [Neurospora crassa OR74A]
MIPFTPFAPAGAAAAAPRQVSAFLFLLLLLTTLTPLVASHAMMTFPIPYASPQQGNGPINGASFPCHYGGGGAGANSLQLPSSGYNVFPLGSKQPLRLIGTAVHGGGSCQISITYDNPPTPQSKFKVIKSIEGGCIARNEGGNRPGASAVQVNPDSYEYSIPDDIPAGNGTIAWTWFNKMGYREMYMACGPVQLTGEEKPGAKETFESLPDILVANLDNGCGTPENKDILFPNPGQNVEKANGATDAFAAPTGQGCQKPTGGALGSTIGREAAATPTPAPAPYSVANGTVTHLIETGATGTAAFPATVSVTGAPEVTINGSTSFPAGVSRGITKPSVSLGAVIATTPPTYTSNTIPPSASTLSTSTIPVSPISQSIIVEKRSDGTLPETVPPVGACPAYQDGWYICHLPRNQNYGFVYYRCASGRWTGAMHVPAGTRCTIKGDKYNPWTRQAPEKELTLEMSAESDDDPLVIIPVTRTKATPNAPMRPTAKV